MITAVTNNLPSWMHLSTHSDLENRICTISERALDSSLSQQDVDDLKQGFKIAHSNSRIKSLLRTIQNEILVEFGQKLATSCTGAELEFILNSCCKAMDTDAVIRMAGFKNEEEALMAFEINGAMKPDFLRNVLAKEGKTIWKEFWIESKYLGYQVLDILISVTGLNDVSRQKAHPRQGSESEALGAIEAKSKLEMYITLISYPAVLFGLIYTYVKFRAAAFFLTSVAVIGAITALVAYKRYFKPCPIDHAGLKNLSVELLRKDCPIYPRWDILRKIEQHFCAKKGVILVGDAGAGKSWIARSFAEQVASGKLCRGFKQLQVFSCNGSSFSIGSWEGNSFPSIEEHFKRHRDQVVFFIDEFHTLFEKSGKKWMQPNQQIKTFCEDFKYVIGATTSKEFEEYVAQEEAIVGRRFEVIRIEPMTRNEMRESLKLKLKSLAAKIDYKPEIFDYIIDKGKKFNKGTSEVDAAHSLLDRAIQIMNAVDHPHQEAHVRKLKAERRVIKDEIQKCEHVKDQFKKLAQLQKKQQELTVAKNELAARKERVQKLQKAQDHLLKLKTNSYHIAKSTKHSDIGKWLNLQVTINIIKKRIFAERTQLGFPCQIDKKLIDKILKKGQCS